MATLLGPLLLVLCVALVVVDSKQHREFGCTFDDEYYNYEDCKEDFGDKLEPMKFDNSDEFKHFYNDLEEVRGEIRFKALHNTIDPFFTMYNAYKTEQKKNPAIKFADFFPTYKPNPFQDVYRRFPHDTPFSVIEIYQMMNTRFPYKYSQFKDSFVLATCDEDVQKSVLDKATKMEKTPQGFVHDRIVGVIPFVIQRKGQEEEGARGFVIVEGTYLTSIKTFAPIVMTPKFDNYPLRLSEVPLFGPTTAMYNWLPGTSESFIKIQYMEYDTKSVITEGENQSTIFLEAKETITQTDLLFMRPRSLCSFVKHVWKYNLLETSVRLLKDSPDLYLDGENRYYMAIQLKGVSKDEAKTTLTWWDWLWTFLYRKTNQINSNHLLLDKFVQPKDELTILQSFPLDEVNKLNKTYNETLTDLAAGFNIEFKKLYYVLQQMSNIFLTDKEFINEFSNYQDPLVLNFDLSTFWNLVDQVKSACGFAIGKVMGYK